MLAPRGEPFKMLVTGHLERKNRSAFTGMVAEWARAA